MSPNKIKTTQKAHFVFSAEFCAAEEKVTAPQRDSELQLWFNNALLRRSPKRLCAAQLLQKLVVRTECHI
jgi:hypothetical protein